MDITDILMEIMDNTETFMEPMDTDTMVLDAETAFMVLLFHVPTAPKIYNHLLDYFISLSHYTSIEIWMFRDFFNKPTNSIFFRHNASLFLYP